MAIFGDYEISRRLYKGAYASVYLARRIDGFGPETGVLKVLDLTDEIVEGKNRQQWLARFLNAARVQQGIANTSKHWAKVHDVGENAAGAFYVTDFHENSAAKLLAGKMHLSRTALHGLLDQTLHGLIDLATEKGRPHGNLKPTNILIEPDKRRGARLGTVVLADPLADEALHPGDTCSVDLQALGKLLHRLVVGREFTHGTLWPLEQTPEWLDLGRRAGPRFRVLCDLLLEPKPPSERSLEDVKHRLVALRPMRRGVRIAIGVAVAIVALVPVGWYAWQTPAITNYFSSIAAAMHRNPATQPAGDVKPAGDVQPAPADNRPAAAAADPLTELMNANNPAAPFNIKLTLSARPSRGPAGGNCVAFTVVADRDCDIVLLTRDSRGMIRLLLPNAWETARASADKPLEIPAGQYEFPIEAPFGETLFKVIATTRRVKLAGTALVLADNDKPFTPRELLRADEWTCADARLMTDEKGNPAPAQPTR